jgi:hypothetical protein
MDNRVRQPSLVTAIEDESLIQTRLQALVGGHPELTTLTKSIPKDCSITREFLTAYFKSNVKGAVKSLVLRVLLGDPSLFPKQAASPAGVNYFRRIAQFFEHHPKQPLVCLTSEFRKEEIPHNLFTVLGMSRTPPRVFFSKFGLIPYLLFIRGQLPHEGYLGTGIKPTDDLSFLRPFYESRRIIQPICEALLTGHATHHAYATYFETGDRALDLRNILFFLREFWQQDRLGGRLQSKIPKVISNLFGLTRVSIPELAFLVDILPLTHLRVINPARLSFKDDHLGIHRVLACVSDSHIEDLEDLILSHAKNWLLTEQKAESMFRIRQEGRREGAYESGFVFNLDRLLTRSTGKRFASYYAAIDNDALTHQVNSHYRSLVPAFADRLVAIQRRFPQEFTGIRIRDLSNILFYYWYHTEQGRNPSGLLPTVAKYALGQTEYEAGPEKLLTRRNACRGRSQEKSRPEEHLPYFPRISIGVFLNLSVRVMFTAHAKTDSRRY